VIDPVASGVVEIPLAGTHLESGNTPFFLGTPFALPEFVVGPENHLVEAVVSAILDGASQSYSPLVVCGPTSSGKTHLVGGLFHAWKNAYPRRPALFVTASDFTREFREAVETKMEDQFHAPYARAQLLVLDNLEQLAGRHPAQQALTAMIDRQASSGGWVVVTSRSPPSQIPGLVAGLQARLTAGLLLRLALPGVETRAAILNRVAELRHLNVAETVLQTLAEGLVAPVPELIGALVQLEAEARLEGLSPTVAAAKRLLAARRDARQPTLATVAKIAAKHYGVSVAQLRSASRQRAMVSARNMAMYLARSTTQNSLNRIGAYFGNRDHTTVSHGCRKVEECMESDPAVRKTAEQLLAKLLLR
jgi:chromosomal replication initiator protein